MTAILIWGVGILLSLSIVFGKSHEEDDSGESSRGFTDFAKFTLVLSMYVISVQIIIAIIKIAMGFPRGIIEGTSIGGIIFNASILIAEIFTFKKNKVGLFALIVLFITRTLLLVPMGTGSYAYFLGENCVHLVRDFGLFAIAMCFKKNGISGWKSIFTSEKGLETIVEESHEESENQSVNEDKQSVVVEEDENPIVEEYSEDSTIEENTQIEKESTQECASNERTLSACTQSSKPIVKNRKPTKLWLWGTITIALFVGIASLCIYVNSQDYPKYVTRFSDKVKYCFSIPNNRLARECIENYRKAFDEEFIELGKEYLATASGVKPNKPTIMCDIAVAYFDIAYKNDDESYYEESKKVVNELLKDNPNDIDALERLAAIYNNLDQMDECYKIAEQLLFICPDNKEGLYYMCRKSYEKKDWNSLEKWGKKGYNLEGEGNSHKFATVGCIYFYAKALYEIGNKFGAMRIYAEAEKEDPFHWLHAEFEELGGIPCAVLSLSVGNKRKDGTIINKPGETIYEENACFLFPAIKVKGHRKGTFSFDVKLYKNGNLSRNSTTSPIGYTYTKEVKLSGIDEQTTEVGRWGLDEPGYWSKGDYKFEIWWKGNKLYSQSFKIY